MMWLATQLVCTVVLIQKRWCLYSPRAVAYPYVMSLQEQTVSPVTNQTIFVRFCSGSLVSNNWVLTTGQCVTYDNEERTWVRFGDLTLRQNATEASYSKARKFVKHEGYFPSIPPRNNIGLVLIDFITVIPIGRVSTIVSSALMRKPMEFAGYAISIGKNTEDRPLKIGKGVAVSCPPSFATSTICLVNACGETRKPVVPGELGGPLIFKNYIVGVLQAAGNLEIVFTEVSPYVDWIVDKMKSIRIPPVENVQFRASA